MLSHILSEKPHVPVCFFADPEYGSKTFKTSRTYPTWAYFQLIEVFLGAFEEKKKSDHYICNWLVKLYCQRLFGQMFGSSHINIFPRKTFQLRIAELLYIFAF